jgi:RNA polymerase sigma-70 factor (ECF subfamily)
MDSVSLFSQFGPTDELLAAARQGSREALGSALESCRTYLVLIANEELDSNLRAKLGPSDVVQETFVTAQRAFGRFHGQSQEELLAWLRQILVNKISETRRHYYRSQRRALAREAPPADSTSGNGSVWNQIARDLTPHRHLVSGETAEHISRALDQLSPHHREVIRLRNWELLGFDEIGRRMGRSAGAARALWMRALEQLAASLEQRDE